MYSMYTYHRYVWYSYAILCENTVFTCGVCPKSGFLATACVTLSRGAFNKCIFWWKMGTQLFRENLPHALIIDFFGKVVVHRFSFFPDFQDPPPFAETRDSRIWVSGDLVKTEVLTYKTMLCML